MINDLINCIRGLLGAAAISRECDGREMQPMPEKILPDRAQESTRQIFAQIFCNYYTFAHPCTLDKCNDNRRMGFVVKHNLPVVWRSS